MAINARFLHASLTDRSREKVVRFYCSLFACAPVDPARNFSSERIGQRLPDLSEPGCTHVAFAVHHMDEAFKAVAAAGGETIAEITLPGPASVRMVYTRDAAGNIVELQKWN